MKSCVLYGWSRTCRPQNISKRMLFSVSYINNLDRSFLIKLPRPCKGDGAGSKDHESFTKLNSRLRLLNVWIHSQFYIQSVNSPHFGTGILLFGPFVQSGQ